MEDKPFLFQLFSSGGSKIIVSTSITFFILYSQITCGCYNSNRLSFPYLSSHADVATDNLLDFDDSVNVVVETNGNAGEDQLDNHRPSETNNNAAWVRSSSSALALTLCCNVGQSVAATF